MAKNFSAHIMSVFSANETSYDEIKNLMTDLAYGREMFDAEGNKISKAEAEAKLRELNMAMFGLSEGYTHRDLKRATRDHIREWFDVVEEVVDQYITTGHDHILQRYKPSETFTIPMDRYAVAVGADINKYMAGQEDWATLVAAIGKAFMIKIQLMVFAQVDNAASKLPVQTGFVDTGKLDANAKEYFDAIIENVSAANGGVNVAIFGTKTALKKITALADVDWAAASQKEAIAMTGRLGFYEGTLLVETPQRFADDTMTTKLLNDNKLYFMPMDVDNKIIAMIDQGETEIDEITEKGEANGRIDDLMKYEAQRTLGVGTKIGRYFGQWTITTTPHN